MNITRISGGSADQTKIIKSTINLKKDKSLYLAKKQAKKAEKKQSRLEKRTARIIVKKPKSQKAKNIIKNKSFSTIYLSHGDAKPHRIKFAKPLLVISLFAAIFLSGAISNQIFSGKTLPGTFVSDINISNLNQAEIIAKLQDNFENTNVIITANNFSKSAKLGDLGIKIDYVKTAEIAISNNNSRNFWSIFAVGKLRPIDLVAEYDAVKTENFIHAAFAGQEVPAKNAEIIWNEASGQFEIIGSGRGSQLPATEIAAHAVALLSSMETINIYAKPIEVIPEIETPDADAAKDFLNQTLLGIDTSTELTNVTSANLVKKLTNDNLARTNDKSFSEIAYLTTRTIAK
ncbi:MAG: hypothetical protein LBM97_02440 [Candidatus Nomurabacteria bacterium]|jgi:hypothetical protein|nr:hypothetical protein [Candidatus Nomurabacteria bacterium]